MSKTRLFALMTCITLTMVGRIGAQQLEPIESSRAQKIAAVLAAEADKISQPQIKITADSNRAVGLHVPQKVGLLVTPQKDLKEGADLSAKFKTEKGAPLGYLFLYNLAPAADGKSIDSSKLRTVDLTDGEGRTHKVTVVLLAVKQLAEDDYRLHVYGQGEKPIVDSKFSEGKGAGNEPVGVELKDVNEATKTGKLVFTVFGKYQVSMHLQGS